MLDTNVPRIRVDRLEEYIEKRKIKCEKLRGDAAKAGFECGYCAESDKIEAYNDILFLIKKTGSD